jgi:hypothetical protein
MPRYYYEISEVGLADPGNGVFALFTASKKRLSYSDKLIYRQFCAEFMAVFCRIPLHLLPSIDPAIRNQKRLNYLRQQTLALSNRDMKSRGALLAINSARSGVRVKIGTVVPSGRCPFIGMAAVHPVLCERSV